MKTVAQPPRKAFSAHEEEPVARPLARKMARELTPEELAHIVGSHAEPNSGISNAGAFGDHDLVR